MKMKQTDSAPRDSSSQSGKSYILFLVFIAILGAFSSLVNDMYLPTIPHMVKEFHTNPSMTQMGLSMAMIGLGAGSVVWGSMSDHYGRKPILVVSLIIFAAGTAVSLLSESIGFFIACRLLQGFGAGGGMVLSYSIPADIYGGRPLAKVMALVEAINGIAPAASPLVGGFMADSVGWRGIFMLLLALGVVMTIWALRRPESLPVARRMAGKSLADYWKAYVALFANRRFMIYVLLKAIGVGLLYAYISSAPFIFQNHYGFSSLHFGLIFGGNAIAIAVGSTLVMRFKVLKNGLVTGAALMSVCALAASWIMYHSMPFIFYELTVIPMLAASGMLFSSANSLGMEVGSSDAGTAGAILNVIKYIFAAIVAPLVGLGDIMRSSAICFAAVAIIALALAVPVLRLKPLSEMTRK